MGYGTVGFSQLDSLRNLIQSDYSFAHDSNEVITRYEYAVELYYASEDSLRQAIIQADQSYDLARKNNLVRHQINAYNLKGIILRKLGEFEEALQTYDHIIALALNHSLDLRAGQMMDNKANVYMRMRKEDQALELRHNALEIFKEKADSNTLAKSYYGIGGLYLQKSHFKKCIDYSQLAVQSISKLNPSDDAAYAAGNMAMAYKRLNQPDSALHYFLQCQELSTDIPYLYRDNQAELARFYFDQKEYDNAISIFQELIAAYKPKSRNFSLHYYRLLLAESYQMMGRYKSASSTLKKISIDIFKGRHKQLMQYYKVSSRLNFEAGNYKIARNEFRLFRDYNDSIRIAQVDINFKEIVEKYQVAEKEKIIATQELSLKNRTVYIILLLALLGITTLLFLLRQRKIKFAKALTEQKNKAQASEIENLRKENKIISMQSMLEGQEEERLRIARDLHDNIGSLMTTIKFKVLDIQKNIEQIQKMNIADELDTMINTASQEIRRISHRMTPVAMEIAGLEGAVLDLGQQLLEQNIQPSIDVGVLDQIEDKNLAINIYRIIQEVVNNTIKHSSATKMNISANIKANSLFLNLSDNGVGFDTSKQDKTSSIGLSGIQSRINYLNGAVELNTKDQTTYNITIPLSNPTES